MKLALILLPFLSLAFSLQAKELTQEEVISMTKEKCQNVPEIEMQRIFCQANEAIKYCIENQDNSTEACVMVKKKASVSFSKEVKEKIIDEKSSSLSEKDFQILRVRKCDGREDYFKCLQDFATDYCHIHEDSKFDLCNAVRYGDDIKKQIEEENK